jgi:hypothetical protein
MAGVGTSIRQFGQNRNLANPMSLRESCRSADWPASNLSCIPHAALIQRRYPLPLSLSIPLARRIYIKNRHGPSRMRLV